jgi:peptide deformylase
MDHLMGKVFVEYLSPLKRNRIKTKMIKEEREIVRDQAARAQRRR